MQIKMTMNYYLHLSGWLLIKMYRLKCEEIETLTGGRENGCCSETQYDVFFTKIEPENWLLLRGLLQGREGEG